MATENPLTLDDINKAANLLKRFDAFGAQSFYPHQVKTLVELAGRALDEVLEARRQSLDAIPLETWEGRIEQRTVGVERRLGNLERRVHRLEQWLGDLDQRSMEVGG